MAVNFAIIFDVCNVDVVNIAGFFADVTIWPTPAIYVGRLCGGSIDLIASRGYCFASLYILLRGIDGAWIFIGLCGVLSLCRCG